MKRRQFFSLPAALPLFAAKTNTLSSPWPPANLESKLIPRNRWNPYPSASARAPWEALRPEARQHLLAEAEAAAPKPWGSLPASVFLDFARNGNRSRYEAIYNERRSRLLTLILGECVEGKGRFLDPILDGLWLTCEETWWGYPAHLGPQKTGSGLPDISDPIIDLFAAETGTLISWTDYLLGPQLAKLSPLVRPRMRDEVERRILTPLEKRNDFGWMGFGPNRRSALNNWTPWICSNCLTAALVMEDNPRRRAALTHKVLLSLDEFLSDYHSDGGCDEGPSYWSRAGASLFDCLDLLHSASAGAVNFYSVPLVQEMGRYIYRAHIAGDWFVNFADASAKGGPAGDIVHRYGTAIRDEKMRAFGAWLVAQRGGQPGREYIGRVLPALFNDPALRATSPAPPLERDVWLDGIQMAAAREAGGTGKGLYFAAQGGHNAESHNHNDVGNFIVFKDGAPVLIDVGVETYSRKTFSSQRYEIWTMQSAWHNCPTIGGVMQGAGRSFEARNAKFSSSEAASEFSADIARAYPLEAGVTRWQRSLRLDRKTRRLELTDDFELSRETGVELSFISVHPLRLEGANAFLGPCRLEFPAAELSAQVDDHETQDARLKPNWGERVYRVRLSARKPVSRGRWKITLA